MLQGGTQPMGITKYKCFSGRPYSVEGEYSQILRVHLVQDLGEMDYESVEVKKLAQYQASWSRAER